MSKEANQQNQVHFTMQGKGGVGKSLSAAIQAQFFREKYGADAVQCYDTDPVNDTLAQYAVFGASRIKILGQDQNINSRAFDELIERLVESNGVAVVDNGASTFVPLMAYMVENGVVDLLQGAGKRVYIHSILTGGQALDDTTMGLARMLEAHPAPVVVWVNEFFGEVEKDGKSFEESNLFKKNKDRIAGTVRMAKRNADTFGKDMELMAKHKLTFDQVMQSDLFGMMPRQRLKMIKGSLFEQLEAIGF